MPHELRNIVVKELREIFRDPRLFIGIVVIPVVMLPLMGSGIRVAFEAAEQALETMQIGFANLEANSANHTMSDLFYTVMIQSNLTVQNTTAADAESALAWAQGNRIDTLVVLPANFTEIIAAGGSAQVLVYQVLHSYGPTEVAGSARVQVVVVRFNALVTAERLRDSFPGSTPAELLAPAAVHEASVIGGVVRDVPPDTVLSAVTANSVMIPLALSLIIVLSGQLAATSVAMEKEQKTLEVLLTLPMKRTYILLGKLTGVILVSAVGTLAMLLSFTYYMQGFQIGGPSPVSLSEIGLAPEPFGYLLLGVSLFLSILAAMALSVLLAAYTKDVRSAQSLQGILFIPVLIPAFLLMFAPIGILPMGLQAVIYAIPFSYSSLAAQAMYTKEYLPILLGIAYQVGFTAAVLVLAARLFASEKVLTARLRLQRKRAAPEQE